MPTNMNFCKVESFQTPKSMALVKMILDFSSEGQAASIHFDCINSLA